MTGPKPGGLFLTLLLATAPFGIWMAWIGVSNETPLWTPIVGSVLLALSLFFLLRCALTDPGVIPRCPAPPPDVLPAPPAHQLDFDGSDLKYCDTCHLFRPPRAKHCRFDDNCCLQFDHFCFWTASSIGLRNYRHFIGFLVAVTAFGAFIAATTGVDVQRRAADMAHQHGQTSATAWRDFATDVIAERPAPFCAGVFAACTALSVAVLLFFHIHLLRLGETTNESVRGVFARRVNPYTKGFWANARAALWDPVPPSQLSFLTQEVTPGSLPGMAANADDVLRRRNWGPTPHISAAGVPSSSYQNEHDAHADAYLDDPTNALLQYPATNHSLQPNSTP